MVSRAETEALSGVMGCAIISPMTMSESRMASTAWRRWVRS